MEKKIDVNEIKSEIKNLKNKVKSIMIASKNDNGDLLSSYAPYSEVDGEIYIIISAVAEHYGNIKEERQINAQIVEDEKDAKMIFFRKRINYKMIPEKVLQSETIINSFDEPKMIKMLLGMDFDLFKLKKIEAKAVFGAGEAYFLDENEDLIKQDTVDKKYN